MKQVPIIDKFKETDFACKCGCGKGYADMKPDLLRMLFDARTLASTPFVISSAYRCEAHNKKSGGKPNSAHLRGYAVDIKAPNSQAAFKILTALLEVGFVRIGWNKTYNFFHVDCDPSLPQEVFFDY